jgi:alpha-tubulin suppressor-like RCC1 family protein
MAKKVVVGYGFTLALTTTGEVRVWGWKNYAGIAGLTDNVLVPSVIPGLESGVVDISTYYQSSCAVLADGTARCWGANERGQLGDGTMTDRETPVPVMGLTGVTSISAGTDSTCAVTSAGTIKCWGDNTGRKLGAVTADPTNSNAYIPSPVPLDVLHPSSGVKAVGVGDGHACAILTSGALECWGDNTFGQCGNGDLSTATIPEAFGDPIPEVLTLSNVVAVAPGGHTTVAVLASGAVKAWGTQADGQLGNNSADEFTDLPTPQDVTGLQTGATAADTSCAVVAGAVRCWSANPGDGTDDMPLTARTATGIADAVQVSSGPHSCAVTSTGAVKCWGENDNGELGKGTEGNQSSSEAKLLTPVPVLGFP